MAAKLTDNGTLLTLGLVGVVAAAGAVKRGSAARRSLVVVDGNDPYEPRPGWYVSNLELGTEVAGPFRSRQDAEERLHRLEASASARSGRRPRTGSRATLDERVADLQFDMTTLFGAREVKRPSELRRLRVRALAENAALLERIRDAKERGVDTRLLERDLRARMR